MSAPAKISSNAADFAETRIPKSESRNLNEPEEGEKYFRSSRRPGLRTSALGLLSGFGIRASDFSPALLAMAL